MAGLELAPVAIEGRDEPAWVLPDALDRLDEGLDDDEVHLLPSQDNLVSLRGAPSMLADAAHHGRPLLGMGGRAVPLGSSSWLNDRPLVARGEWLGLWDWDPEAGAVIFAGFGELPPDVRRRATDKAEALAVFIQAELEGEARAHSIDSEASRRARAARVRELE